MSSFVGHSLAALTIGKAFEKRGSIRDYIIWQVGLLACAIAPDIDYAVAALNAPNNGNLRITHSIAFSLIVPAFITLPVLIFVRKDVLTRAFQAVLAGLSHPFLDLLVGSRDGDPLFFPIWNKPIVLPFGILPAAGAMRLDNFYFYRNLAIELGILVPVFTLLLYAVGKFKLNRLVVAGLVITLAIFLTWSISLNR